MGACSLGAAGGIRMAVRLRMTARKLKPLIRKQVPSPTTASSSPAMAGPTTRAALNTAELSEMALIRSSRLVIWITSAWRPGMSKALITPSRPASTSTCQTCTRPVRVSAASAKACTIDRVWVTMTTLRREKRSAAIPPSGPSANTAICEQNQAVPKSNSEWVRRYTSQACATFCIQVPTSETIWPPIKSRKLRWRRARKVLGIRLGASSGASSGTNGGAGSSPNCGGETSILIFQNNARYNGGSIIRGFQEKKFWRTTKCIRRSTWAAAPLRSPSPSERRARCVNRSCGTRAAARASRSEPRALASGFLQHKISRPPPGSTFQLLRSRRGEYKLFPSREEVHSMRVFSLALALALALCAVSSAQDTTATIEGRVLDPSGRVITGAVVRATNASTGFTRSQITSSSGAYHLSLPAAAYDILVEAPDFARLTQKDVQLNVSQTARIDFSLTILRDKEVVAVTAEVPTVQTSSNEIGNVVTGRELVDLPLDGRNFTQLGLLQPGVAPLTAGLAEAGGSLRSGQAYSVDGQRPESNNYLLDGVTNVNRVDGGYALRTPVDAIQEFRILTETAPR